ncbi:hypothetical protein HDZ31DRAFT_75014 [Schizophyllum fasciatum]
MSLPLIWPGTYYFYPIGNTSAVCLTRDLAPESPANILLLGCGDPRSILYTTFLEQLQANRTLDFTCNDNDAAILGMIELIKYYHFHSENPARNIVLLTTIANGMSPSTAWALFYHMKLDKPSHATLVAHCKKLVSIGPSLDDWRASGYARFIHFSTILTYLEVRRHWALYSAMHELPRRDRDRIAANYAFRVTEVLGMPLEGSSARSAGPFARAAADVMAKKYKAYWRSGTVFDDPSQASAAIMVNPMFVYSLGGARYSVQSNLDPLTGFHYADLYGNAENRVTGAEVTAHALRQFGDWARAFADAVKQGEGRPTVVVRFLLGEATAVCRALRTVVASRQTKTDVAVAHFESAALEFTDEYASDDGDNSAPVEFHIIDTSNLDDHIGLVNCFVASLPLLVDGPEATIYTESLFFRTTDATTEIKRRLHADIVTMALLMGIAPVDFLSSFSSRSNLHELRTQQDAGKPAIQYHQVTAWRRPLSCDSSQHVYRLPIRFGPIALGDLLLNIYYSMFEQEDPAIYKSRTQDAARHIPAGQWQMVVYYNRESFVLFLDRVRSTLGMPPEKWNEAMYRFLDRNLMDRTKPHDMARRYELYALMYHLGVYAPYFHDMQKMPPAASLANRLRAWSSIPPILRIVFSIPRERVLAYLGNPVTESAHERSSTSLQRQTFGLQCHVGASKGHIFTAIQVAFGHIAPAGTAAWPSYTLRADPDGWRGSSPLLATFLVPVRLIESLSPSEAEVRLTSRVDEVRGMEMPPIFHQNIWTSDEFVKIYPATPQPLPIVEQTRSASAGIAHVDIGDGQDSVALSRRIRLRNTADSSAETITITQPSPCVMRATTSDATQPQDLLFHFPIMSGENTIVREPEDIFKVRPEAHQSPPRWPDLSRQEGLRSILSPVGSGGSSLAWNLHRIELDKLPIVRKADTWLKSHVRLSLSSRERTVRSEGTTDPLTGLKLLINDIILGFTKADGASAVFALGVAGEKPVYVFFAQDMRFDLPNHSIALNGFILETGSLGSADLGADLDILLANSGVAHLASDAATMKMWQHAVPAFAERCRTWAHTRTSGHPCTVMLCGCGSGRASAIPKECEPFAAFVTQVAVSPLFGVSYVEPVLRGRQCNACGKKDNLRMCARCKKVKYCGGECQKRDWRTHKAHCKQTGH